MRESILEYLSKQTDASKPIRIANETGLNKNSVRRELQLMLKVSLVTRDENHAYRLLNGNVGAASTTSAPTEDAASRACRTNDSRRMKPHCPICAGTDLLRDGVRGKAYLCRECKHSFDEPLQMPPCPKCKSSDRVGRKFWKQPEGGRVLVILRCFKNAKTGAGCNVSFQLNPEQRYRRHPPKVYAYVLFHAMQGKSYDAVASGLRHTYHVNVDELTIRRWVIAGAYRAAHYLLSLPMKTSGHIYLDEKPYPVHHKSEGQEWSEEWWVWNSYDSPKKLWFASLVRKGRGQDEAYELILRTLAMAIPPDSGEIYLWCDGLDKYRYAYEKLVAEQKIDPTKIHLMQVPKEQVYWCINEIEGLHSLIGELIGKKLRPSEDEAGAQVRVDGERVQHLFVKRVPEFEGKTRAANAGVDLRLGDSEWERIAALTQLLKVEKFKNYELKVNVTDTEVLNRISKHSIVPATGGESPGLISDSESGIHDPNALS